MSGEYRTCVVSIGTSAHTTAGHSLFEAAASALHWWEVDCQSFRTAWRPGDDEVMTVALVGGETYRVRVGRVREWMAGP